MKTKIEVRYHLDETGRYPAESVFVATEKEARRAAAEMLGHASLRGAAVFDTEDGVAYQFGPRKEQNGYEYVEIIFH